MEPLILDEFRQGLTQIKTGVQNTQNEITDLCASLTQVQVVEGFSTQGVQGIVLAPLDNRALVRPVEEAKRAGVPTVSKPA